MAKQDEQVWPGITPELHSVMNALCDVAARLSKTISRGKLEQDLGAELGDNLGGDTQKALDVMADDAFASALKGTGMKWYASEEQDIVVPIDEDGTYAIAIDPLDGSSNIDVNVSIGTIFGIQKALDDGEATFLRSGRHLVCAGYFIYGPQTALIVTFGAGVLQYLLDRDSGRFLPVGERLVLPHESSEFAINASNYRHWPQPIRAYIDDCLAGSEGPRGANFNMRWVASLVAETHRIITRGGIFLYPADDRKGYGRGRLRLVYECAPIAMLIEQAQGRATTGTDPVLDKVPDGLHARTPFVFGTPENVDRVASYFDLPEQEISALFGNRGLFRA